jgi:hypothetical protein
VKNKTRTNSTRSRGRDKQTFALSQASEQFFIGEETEAWEVCALVLQEIVHFFQNLFDRTIAIYCMYKASGADTYKREPVSSKHNRKRQY